MSTSTPGNTAPVWSLTTPLTVADVAVCPRAGAAALNAHTIASHRAGDQNFDRMKKTSGGSKRTRPQPETTAETAEHAERRISRDSARRQELVGAMNEEVVIRDGRNGGSRTAARDADAHQDRKQLRQTSTPGRRQGRWPGRRATHPDRSRTHASCTCARLPSYDASGRSDRAAGPGSISPRLRRWRRSGNRTSAARRRHSPPGTGAMRQSATTDGVGQET